MHRDGDHFSIPFHAGMVPEESDMTERRNPDNHDEILAMLNRRAGDRLIEHILSVVKPVGPVHEAPNRRGGGAWEFDLDGDILASVIGDVEVAA